jgi:hypothetical protein
MEVHNREKRFPKLDGPVLFTMCFLDELRYGMQLAEVGAVDNSCNDVIREK